MSHDEAPTGSQNALASYFDMLAFLGASGHSQFSVPAKLPELPFLQQTPGMKHLFLTMSSVAPAVPDTSDEEWNPLAQRPHAVLSPMVADELGAELTALKLAIDNFTILSHEMMHVALWEPFFVGRWCPKNRKSFQAFSLMAEGYCYFFTDIHVSSAIRVRLPDGEFALDRQSPSNALFHPIRAFQSAEIHDPNEILDIYLNGFSGQPTRLWQSPEEHILASSLAAQAFAFYRGSLSYLDELYPVLNSFGALTQFYRRFCSIEGLPSFIPAELGNSLQSSEDLSFYFKEFYAQALPHAALLTQEQIEGVRMRRMLQMRAFYALQVEWLLENNLVYAREFKVQHRKALLKEVSLYVEQLESLLHNLAQGSREQTSARLKELDAHYEGKVRSSFLRLRAWVGHRWLIAPKRAGGLISLKGPASSSKSKTTAHLAHIAQFFVETLAESLAETKTTKARAKVLERIQSIAKLGALCASGKGPTKATWQQLLAEAVAPDLISTWSVPLASFDPFHNQYRELLFSYQ